MSEYIVKKSFILKPKRPEFSSPDARIKTFNNNWKVSFLDPNTLVNPETLVKAGLFYLGSGDRVRCYFCGGGFHKWEPGDVPLTEHKRLYPACGFLRELEAANDQLNDTKSKL